MFFDKTKIYTVHVKPNNNSSKALEETVLVKEGFSWFAFLFPAIWALFNKMWLLSILLFAIFTTVNVAYELDEMTVYAAFIIKITIQLFIGFSSDDLIRNNLKQKNYMFYDIVSGTSESSAQLRFIEKYT